jgi:hypothetical protein
LIGQKGFCKCQILTRFKAEKSLGIRDYFITIITKDFKDMVQSSYAEGREGKFLKHFRSVDSVVSSLNAEVIHLFVADARSKQTIEIDAPRIVFPEDIAKIQDFIQLINKEDSTDGKGYIFIRLNFISS